MLYINRVSFETDLGYFEREYTARLVAEYPEVRYYTTYGMFFPGVVADHMIGVAAAIGDAGYAHFGMRLKPSEVDRVLNGEKLEGLGFISSIMFEARYNQRVAVARNLVTIARMYRRHCNVVVVADPVTLPAARNAADVVENLTVAMRGRCATLAESHRGGQKIAVRVDHKDEAERVLREVERVVPWRGASVELIVPIAPGDTSGPWEVMKAIEPMTTRARQRERTWRELIYDAQA